MHIWAQENLLKLKWSNKIPSAGLEGDCNTIEESLDLETNISSSLGNWSSIFELTFMTASSYKNTEKKVENKRVQFQNEKGHVVTSENKTDQKSLHLEHH